MTHIKEIPGNIESIIEVFFEMRSSDMQLQILEIMSCRTLSI